MKEISSGSVRIFIAVNSEEAGRLAAEAVIDSGLNAVNNGKRPAFWLMAAPSAFSFYKAFVEMARTDSRVVAMVREADWFQFDDYPISRKNPRFPVTFRHLLETHFFGPLEHNVGDTGTIHSLELTGSEADDDAVMKRYKEELTEVLENPDRHVIQVKGIGMDGHWGFHGAETPLDAEPGLVRVAMNAANRRQQMIDWPEYFPEEGDVPEYAVTCTAALFLKAQCIIDIVPQPQKEYAVLACYGSEAVLPEIPSSALKNHGNARSYLTQDSAGALLEYRSSQTLNKDSRLSTGTVNRLEGYWRNQDNPRESELNIRKMLAVLKQLEMV